MNLTLEPSSRLLTLLLLLVSYTPESLRWCSAYEAAHVQPPKDYFFTGGPGKLFLRHVKPYFFSYRGNAKARWLGRRIIDVYSSEFPLYSPAYYSAAISYGCITVNSKAVGVDYVVRNGDVIEHLVHRHEPPVLAYGNGEEAARVRIVADNPELLAVDKPPSVPVHPCGQYYHNSLLLQVASERMGCSDPATESIGSGDQSAWAGLHVVHRLDRITSGLTLFAKSSEAARRFSEDLRAGHTTKTYLARVTGDFELGKAARGGTARGSVQSWRRSAEMLEKDAKAIGWSFEVARAHGGAAIGTSEGAAKGVRVQQPIRSSSRRHGVYECPFPAAAAQFGIDLSGHATCTTALTALQAVAPVKSNEVKPATTIIRKLSFDALSKTSLVEVTPLHGRTHQIRLHLHFLGHPIVNDRLYGVQGHESAASRVIHNIGSEASHAMTLNDTEAEEAIMPPRQEGEQVLDYIRRTCKDCKKDKLRSSDDQATGDQQGSAPRAEAVGGICLHALRYERHDPATPDLDWSFQTQQPQWAYVPQWAPFST